MRIKVKTKTKSGKKKLSSLKGKKGIARGRKPKPADPKKLREKRKNGSSKFANTAKKKYS